ncbi:type III PLP-dependent enzyme [Nocardia asteroides]|uniref:type III PLP-dependent enzyme n=1 Tax=Nocardia asteroides TaxID=1824 RepID=UPI001E36B89B|nr:type III PLP-dependent enzyme [Nocardia asteroides]UGT55387.1 type III PLP-dependent enzyme [Nocardia asteroides]
MIALSETAAAWATDLPDSALPAYLYDLVGLRAHAAAVRAALPERVELYYAAKANPEPRVLAALAESVDGFEVSSGGELAHVAATVPGRPLAFGGPGKTPAELRAALAHGVHRVHVESVGELRALGALTAGADRPVDVLLRVNLPLDETTLAGSALAMGGRPTPFGLDPRDADTVLGELARGRYPGLRWRGVHAHLTSGLEAPELAAVAASVLRWATDTAGRHDIALTEVNIGGGMNVDYTAPRRLFDWAAYGAALDELLRPTPELRLRIEPGRSLTAYCGWYATDVLDVKSSHGGEFAVVRGGTHHLRTPATKGHSQPCAVIPVDRWDHSWARPATTTMPVDVAGQLCTPKDQLARDLSCDQLRAGDRLVFGLAGAYAWNISHHEFLMHPPPSFHFADDAPVRP